MRILIVCMLVLCACNHKKITTLPGKIKRETISFSPKVTGRILKIYVQEGQQVKPGDTLAMLDVPEVSAKIAQAKGAYKAVSAQHLLADNGPTQNQLKQLRAKYAMMQEQFDFASKSYKRANAMFADSLLSPQAHDEAYARYQSAKAQLDAVAAELNEAETGTRYETKIATSGQQEQAGGILQEVEVAYSERYIIATNYMAVETIATHEGELAAAGYPVFNGYIPNSTWFRFTIPESKVAPYKKGGQVSIRVPYENKIYEGHILTIKQLPKYADITTAYPDYEMDEAVYELKIAPDNIEATEGLLYNASITMNPL
ncbi:biotin/lipoyl-binding protein [Chitinophaga sp.]|uniref:HlyD family secretion protein n=1 Tax=Chitinophaga sp. TaxID=1869181 RepID=UPI0031CDFE7C